MPQSIEGKVFNPQNQPLKKVTVTAEFPGIAPIDSALTGNDGVYKITVPQSGKHKVSAKAPQPSNLLDFAAEVDVPNAAIAPLDVKFEVLSLTGIISDAANQPVAGAVVTADIGGVKIDSPATIADGKYKVELKQAGKHQVSVKAPPGGILQDAAAVEVDIPNAGAAPKNFTLQPQAAVPAGVGSITGTITTPDKKPAAGVNVTAKKDVVVLGPVATGIDGKFTIPNVPPGDYKIELADVQDAHTPDSSTVTVAAGAPTVVDVALEPLFKGDGTEFGLLQGLFKNKKRFAPEPPVNIDEATEMTRLYMAGTLVFSGLASAITQLFDANLKLGNNTGGVSSFNGLALRKTANRGQWGSGKLGDPAKPQEQFDVSSVATEIKENDNGVANGKADLMRALRSAFAFGRATVEPPINSEFLEVFKRFVELSTDDRNGIDPEDVKPGGGKVVTDARQYEQVRTFLRDYKRAIMRLVGNLSLAGSAGTMELSEKWSGILRRAMEVIDDVAVNNVVSTDKDAQYPWTVLAALTAKDRSYVKRYIVHADSGTELLRNAVAIYDKIQALGLLSDESDKSLRDIFITPGAVFKDEKVSDHLMANASVLKDNWISDWNVEV